MCRVGTERSAVDAIIWYNHGISWQLCRKDAFGQVG